MRTETSALFISHLNHIQIFLMRRTVELYHWTRVKLASLQATAFKVFFFAGERSHQTSLCFTDVCQLELMLKSSDLGTNMRRVGVLIMMCWMMLLMMIACVSISALWSGACNDKIFQSFIFVCSQYSVSCCHMSTWYVISTDKWLFQDFLFSCVDPQYLS